ncbi:hypothetical protein F8203_gp103 [Heliothis virescens ascovirus 3f]|uniref:Uncharacterized protein n=1 Tax=Heliothis virescens ascovirus 3f TaxID=328614 RepID=A0A171PVJ4_9VIRU|nr:hypothetical protein F8203_gp103 [Heliothis virescens ascovirus 3f]AJP09069.1 hypothetical protein [Heliothis virescens ascovirus 3f]
MKLLAVIVAIASVVGCWMAVEAAPPVEPICQLTYPPRRIRTTTTPTAPVTFGTRMGFNKGDRDPNHYWSS